MNRGPGKLLRLPVTPALLAVSAALLLWVPIAAATLWTERPEPHGVQPLGLEGTIAEGTFQGFLWRLTGYDSSSGYCLDLILDGRPYVGGCGFGVESGEREIGSLRFVSVDQSVQLVVGLSSGGTTDARAILDDGAVVHAENISAITSSRQPLTAFLVPLPADYRGGVVLQAVSETGSELHSEPLKYPITE